MPYDAWTELAGVNGHMSGVHLDENSKARPPMFQGIPMVQPGSHDWLMLRVLRQKKVTATARTEHMKRLKWYKRSAYDGEFCFDFVCAADLLCWARDKFDRMGDVYPGQKPEQMTHADFCDFALVMEEWYTEALGLISPPILDSALVCATYCDSALFLLSGGIASDELSYAVAALEKVGRPPRKLDPDGPSMHQLVQAG